MSKSTEYTMDWNIDNQGYGKPWDVDVKVIFTYAEWDEKHPYGSTTASEHMEEINVQDVRPLKKDHFEPYPERDKIVKDSFIERLNEDERFLEAARQHVANATAEEADPNIP